MIDQLSPLYRKILALTLLALAIVTVAGFIILPLYNLIETKSAQVEQTYSSVERYQNILGREDIYRTRLATIRQAPLPEITYNATSHAALNSQMQNDIRSIIQRSGGNIDNMQSIPPTPEDGFQRIGLRMSLRADSKLLNKILQNMALHSKLLNFGNVSIRTPENQRANQAAVRAPVVTIRWDIYGYGLLSAGQGGGE
jgi:general secretion pathway protein M